MSSCLEWRGLTYCTNANPQLAPALGDTLLNRLSGEALSGEITAVIGSAGSGKSLLLKCLSGRVAQTTGVSISGHIYLDSCEVSVDRASYVSDQVAALFPHLTVWESLYFSALFRLPPDVSYAAVTDRVTKILAAMNLLAIRHRLVGQDGAAGLSGGERRRLLIAQHLTPNPAILLLDDPCRGLDGYQSQCMMELLKGLASAGRMVICSLSQPRASIFSLVDRLVVLSEGMSLYCGPTSAVIPYFTTNGFLFPQTCNPLDLLVDLTTIDCHSRSSAAQSRARVSQLAARWALHRRIETSRRSSVGSANTAAVDTTALSTRNPHSVSPAALGGPLFQHSSARHLPRAHLERASLTLASIWVACWSHPCTVFMKGLVIKWGPCLWARNMYLLVHRDMLRRRRCWEVVLAEVLLGVALSALAVIMYAVSERRGNDGSDGFGEHFHRTAGALFLVVMLQTISRTVFVMHSIPCEKHMVAEELTTKCYSVSSYVLAKLLAEIPIICVHSVLLCCVFYWSLPLDSSVPGKVLIFFLTVAVLSTASTALGLAVGAVGKNTEEANLWAVLWIGVSCILGGYLVSNCALPPAMQMLQSVSVMWWAFLSLMQNEHAGQEYKGCSDAQLERQECVRLGDDALEMYFCGGQSVIGALTYLAVLASVCIVVAIAALLLRANKFVRMNNKPPETSSPPSASSGTNGVAIDALSLFSSIPSDQARSQLQQHVDLIITEEKV